MSAHRYWRILATASYDGNYVSAAEIEFYNANLQPLINGITSGVIASGFVESGPASAVDRNAGSRWSSAAGMPQYIGYDFGAGNTFDVRRIKWQNRVDGFYSQAPSALKVQYSDDNTTWTDAWTVSGIASWSTSDTRYWYDPARPDPAIYSFWRIYVTASYGTSFNQLGCEVEWLDVSNVDLTAPGISVLTPGDEASFPNSNLYDNDASTFHQWTAGAALPLYGGVIFDGLSAPDVRGISIKAHASFADRMPKTFTVQKSTGNGTWVDVATFTNVPSWTGSEKRTYSLGIVSASVRPQVFVCT